MITNIKTENVKGISGSFDLRPLTLITGDNMSGKTAIADAIRWGLLGYHPLLPSTNSGKFRLSSGERMSVSLTLNFGGFPGVIHRALTLKGKSVKSEESAPPMEEFLPILNTQAFVAAKPKDRLEMLAKAGAEAEFSPEFEELTGGVDSGKSAFEVAEAAVARLNEQLSEARALKRRYTETLQGLADLAPIEPGGEIDPTAGEKLFAAKQRFELATKALAELKAREAAAAAVGQIKVIDVDAARERLTALQGELAATQAQYEAQLSILRDKRDAEAKAKEVIAVYSARVDELNKYKADHPGDEPADVPQPDRQSLDAANARFANALKNRDKARADLEQFDQLTECPTCRASAPGWKEAVKLHLSQSLAAAEAEVLAAEADKKHADNQLAAWKTRADWESKYARWQVWQGHQNKIQEIKTTVAETESKIATLRKEREATQAKVEELGAKIDELKQNIAREEMTLEEAADTAAEQAKLRDRPTPEALAAAEAEVAAALAAQQLAEQAAAAQDEIRKRLEQKRIREQNELAAADGAEEAEKKIAELTTKRDRIKELVQESMAKSYGPIVATAAGLAAGILHDSLDVHEEQLGAWRGGQFVPFELLSGTEQIVATAAIQMALSAQMGGLVILDELSRMSADRKTALAARLAELISLGTLSQAILIDHDEAAWDATPALHKIKLPL